MYPTGDYERRMTGFSPVGEFACFECGYTDRFRKDRPVYFSKEYVYMVDPHGNKKGGGNQKGGKIEKAGKNHVKGGNSGVNVRFTSIENGDP